MLPGKTFHLPFFFDELFTFEEKELNKGVPTDDEKICILLYTDKNVLSLKKTWIAPQIKSLNQVLYVSENVNCFALGLPSEWDTNFY